MLDEYIPDPLEILDMQIDRMIEQYVEGQCMRCGKQVGEENLVLASPHPASAAVCLECAGIDKL
jgi:hypothetical protein